MDICISVNLFAYSMQAWNTSDREQVQMTTPQWMNKKRIDVT